MIFNDLKWLVMIFYDIECVTNEFLMIFNDFLKMFDDFKMIKGKWNDFKNDC